MCELIQHSADVRESLNHLYGTGASVMGEESSSHCLCYTCTHARVCESVCVEALNHNPEMIFPSAEQRAEIVRDRIYGNGHKR